MRFIRFLLPFLLIVLLLSRGPQILALFGHMKYIEYHVTLEGNRILRAREKLLKGEYPPNYQMLLAGSSRTMADFGPRLIEAEIGKTLQGLPRIRGFNLGNVANCYSDFEKHVRKYGPPLLVLEFSPHLMLKSMRCNESLPEPSAIHRGFSAYRKWIEEREQKVSGFVLAKLGLDEFLTLRAGVPKLLWSALRNKEHDFSRVYVATRSHNGYGQVIQPDGQVFYHAYLPDKRAAKLYRELEGGSYGEFDLRLNSPLDEIQWNSLKRIIELFSGPGRQLVVLRPPVAPELYLLENRRQAPQIERVISYLSKHHVPYLDMNPNEFFMADESHIDWFDTNQASQTLGRFLFQNVDWNNLRSMFKIGSR